MALTQNQIIERDKRREKVRKWRDMSMRLHHEIKRGEKINSDNFVGDNKERFEIMMEYKYNPDSNIRSKFHRLEKLIKKGKSILSYLNYLNILRGKSIDIQFDLEAKLEAEIQNLD